MRESSAFDEKTGRTITCPRDKPGLVPGAVPTLLPGCPSYLSSSSLSTNRPCPTSKAQLREEQHVLHALEASEESFREEDSMWACGSLDDIKIKLHLLQLDLPWTTLIHPTTLHLCFTSSDPAPCIISSITISSDMQATVSLHGAPLPSVGDISLPHRVSSMRDIDQIISTLQQLSAPNFQSQDTATAQTLLTLNLVLRLLSSVCVQSSKFFNALSFVHDQIALIVHNLSKNSMSYPSEYLVFSSIFYNVSPHAYRFLRDSGKVILPSYSTVRRLILSNCMDPRTEQTSGTFLYYIGRKFKSLKPRDFIVNLLIDEIHLHSFFDFKGGNVVGSSYNDVHSAATTAFAFMITSAFSSYKDVVHVLPSCKMNGETLFAIVKRMIVGLESIGFTVISVITDNNRINRKAMSFFANPSALLTRYPHPVDPDRPLFFIFDSVHLLKSVRNNWLNVKTIDKSLYYPHFNFSNLVSSSSENVQTASIGALKKLLEYDTGSLLKFSYRLSHKALNPSNLDRQKVSLALRVFNEYVAQGLLSIGEKMSIPDYAGTSLFIKIIVTWWYVVNVKSPLKGQRLNNEFEKPLMSGSHVSKDFMKYFVEWLRRWNAMSTRGFLTMDTFSALLHTSNALMEISEYCLQEFDVSYVLLGKFQTDCLEARFGMYRQLAGGQYDVSLRQVFECEKKIRMLSVLKLTMNNASISLSDFSINWEDCDSGECNDVHVLEPLTIDDVSSTDDVLPVIVYVAGYCCYSICKKLSCSDCKTLLTCAEGDVDKLQNSYTQGISRGSLLYPHETVVKLVRFTYLCVNKLCSDDAFLKVMNHRQSAVDAVLNLADDENIVLLSCNNHTTYQLTRMVVWCCVNTLLNNYVSSMNDKLGGKLSKGKKRKLTTLDHE